ncbi:hypothetical protein FWG95_01195 [Candidatus Saccharibacteria bacterium]|nr:hypothetical protein [Candidatus Saccharibacteria bacterium]
MNAKSNKKKVVPVFTKPEYLSETDKFESFNLTTEQIRESKRMSEIIKLYSDKKQSRIIAYLGAFGSGKSVVLHDATTSLKNISTVNFDIWQYSNDSQIWDSFIISSISDISGKEKQDIANDIDGRDGTPVPMQFLKGLAGFLALLVIYGVASFVLWKLLKGTDFWRAFMIYAIPLFFTVAALLGITTLFPKTKSSITRTFQYEKKLIDTINHNKRTCVMVVEDVDRTEGGERFLESLHVFLQNDKLKQAVIVICPQDTGSFGSTKKPPVGTLQTFNINKLGRSIKIYDDVINSWLPNKMNMESLQKLLDNLGNNDKKFLEIARQLVEISDNESILNIRALKFIFREIYDLQLHHPNVNVYLALICVSSRYITTKELSSSTQLSSTIISSIKDILYNNSGKLRPRVCDIFLLAIDQNAKSWLEEHSRLKISIAFKELDGREYETELKDYADATVAYSHTPPPTTLDVSVILDNKYRKLMY